MGGSLTVAPGKPLAEDLRSFLDGKEEAFSEDAKGARAQNSAVYVALGTTARLLEPEVRGMAANLAALHRPVLWKISDAELPGEVCLQILVFDHCSMFSKAADKQCGAFRSGLCGRPHACAWPHTAIS